MPTMSKNALRASRSRRTPSDPIPRQPDSVYFSRSRPCRKSRDDGHSRHRRSHCHCPAAINHLHHPACPNPCVPHSGQLRQHHDITHSPHDGTASNVPSLDTITTSTPTSSDAHSVDISPHCDRKFT
ncbi:hypothetical protein SprV_0200569000 [Sparganum proliferum]